MTRPDPLARARATRRVAAAVVAVLAAVGVWATWRVFVGSARGQLLDEIAFEGSYFGRTTLLTVAEPVLEIVSIPFMAAVLVAAMLLAVVRRRVLVAVQVAVVMGGSNLATQLLKHVVLPRPEFHVGMDANTLPSGHTTAAASVSAALLFVVPRRLRPVAAVLGAGYTVATGVSTLVGRWHRPSDAVASVLVVLVFVALACALQRREPPSARDAADPTARGRDRRAHLVAAGVLLATAGVTGALAVAALVRTLGRLGEIPADVGSVSAYAGGALGVTAATCLVLATALGLLLPFPRGAVGAESGDGGSTSS